MYQTIVNIFERVANEVNPAPNGYFFEGRVADTYEMNAEAGAAVHLYPFITTDTDRGAKAEISLGFWKIDDAENSIEDRRAIISEMYNLASQFLEKLSEDSDVQFLDKPQREPQYQTLSSSYSGYFVTFTAEIFGQC